mgnify:CR=1 FL=1
MGTSRGMPMSHANLESHIASLHASLAATYSTSVVDKSVDSSIQDVRYEPNYLE